MIKTYQWLCDASIPEMKCKLCMIIMNLVQRDSGASGSCSQIFRLGYSQAVELDVFPAFRETEETQTWWFSFSSGHFNLLLKVGIFLKQSMTWITLCPPSHHCFCYFWFSQSNRKVISLFPFSSSLGISDFFNQSL